MADVISAYSYYFSYLLRAQLSSPMKKSSDGTKYYEYMTQTENGARKALCFYSNNKRPRIQEAQSIKYPVKIGRFNTSRAKIFMNRKSIVMLLVPNDASFECNSSLAETAIVEIVELPRLAPGQLVNIRGQITKVGDVTSHLTYNNERIDKQEVLARNKN